MKNHSSVISVSTHPINHYYFIPTVYITRCVLACLVEVLTTRLSRIIPPPLFTHLEGNDAFVINNENDVTTFPPNEMAAATKQTPEVVFFFR